MPATTTKVTSMVLTEFILGFVDKLFGSHSNNMKTLLATLFTDFIVDEFYMLLCYYFSQT